MAYDEFPTIVAAIKSYRRLRKRRMFIVADTYIASRNPVCSVCGKRFAEHKRWSHETVAGNRCEYDPATKRVAVMEYYCSWNAVMGQLETLVNR